MKTEPPFRSLRLRLLTPLVLTASFSAVIVAAVSYSLGNRWASDDLQSRFDGIQASLSDSRFPLNATVLELLAELTSSELVSIASSGSVRYSTVDLDDDARAAFRKCDGETRWQVPLRVGDESFRVYTFATVGEPERQDRAATIAVLFEEAQIEASRRRAALLPLATGLSVIVALSSITYVLASRLVNRIGKLRRRVELVADGDFESTVADNIGDELGRLGHAVDSMSGQLDGLWKQVNRQQSEKLLHQIAGGMAHQLRNSLTGARMAVELHAADCSGVDDEGIQVAISQIELSEDYVRRLLLVASGRQDEDRPTEVLTCFDDVRKSLTPIAKHLQIDVEWETLGSLEEIVIVDGPTWVAAVTNLIQNAMQAGDHIEVSLSMIENDVVRIRVTDNGSGVTESVASELFEPFVTSKPEGMGLGLPVVKRAAARLGGDVCWRRDRDQTIFEFDAARVAKGEPS